MSFYLFQCRYTTQAIKAMVDTPTNREAAAKDLAHALGAKVHHLFFTFGPEDIVVLIEAPDDETMAAMSMAVGASGALSAGSTTKLMTADEAMGAMARAQIGAKAYKPATA